MGRTYRPSAHESLPVALHVCQHGGMKMTEAFAATVAGVAPLIVLAGVLEMRTYLSIIREPVDATTTALNIVNESVRLLGKADKAKNPAGILNLVPEAERVASQISNLNKRVRNLILTRHGADSGGILVALGQGMAWAAATLVLTGTEACSLGFLGGIKAFRGPNIAAFCFYGIVAGMLVAVILPLLSMVASVTRPILRSEAIWQRTSLFYLRLWRRTRGHEEEELLAIVRRSAPLLEPFLPLVEEIFPKLGEKDRESLDDLTRIIREASQCVRDGSPPETVPQSNELESGGAADELFRKTAEH